MLASVLAVSAVIAVCGYLKLLSDSLKSSRYVRPEPFPTDDALIRDGETWTEIDMLRGTAVAEPTGKRYLVLGGSGNVGSACVKLLHDRGEQHIFVSDVMPLPDILAGLKVTFIKCDISSQSSVQAVFAEAKPDVVIHFASIIRFYERTKATYTLSSHINVDGTKHVIDALRGMPPSSDKILVYCSSAGVLVPAFRPFRLRWKWSGYRNRFARSCVIDDDLSIPDSEIQTNHYTQTKWAADKLVRQANGADGLRTGVLRPGMALQSPNDLAVSSFLQTRDKENMSYVIGVAQTHMNVYDCALAHLYYEKALRERPQEVGGDAFVITGAGEPWAFAHLVHTMQLFAPDVKISLVPVLPLYLMGYVIEWFCDWRYWILSGWNRYTGQKSPSVYPASFVKERVQFLQPPTWNTSLMDVVIDDSRARKVLGYRHKWSNAQTIAWIVDYYDRKAGKSTKGISVPQTEKEGVALSTANSMR